jgi:predicted transcriptional regulator
LDTSGYGKRILSEPTLPKNDLNHSTASFKVSHLQLRTVDLTDFIPQKIGNKKLNISVDKNRIAIHILCPGHSNELILCRHLPLTEENLMAFGFADAEMGKSKRVDYFGVVNSDEHPLLLFKRLAEKYFFIQSQRWKLYIVYSRPKKESTEIERKIMKWWSKKLNVSEKNVIVDWQKSRHRGEPLGSARLYVYGKDLKEIFLQILVTLKSKIIIRNREFALWYLKGKELGDGTVTLRKRGTIDQIGMTSANLHELEVDKEMYGVVGLSMRGPRFRRISTGALKDIIVAVKDGHFQGNARRRLKILKGFLLALEIKTAHKYLRILKEGNSDIYEIAGKIGVTRQSAHYFLQKAVKLGWVTKKWIPPKFIYTMSVEGEKLVDLIERAVKEKVEIESSIKKK